MIDFAKALLEPFMHSLAAVPVPFINLGCFEAQQVAQLPHLLLCPVRVLVKLYVEDARLFLVLLKRGMIVRGLTNL